MRHRALMKRSGTVRPDEMPEDEAAEATAAYDRLTKGRAVPRNTGPDKEFETVTLEEYRRANAGD